MTQQQVEKIKSYEEKAEELVSLTLDVCESKLMRPAQPSELEGNVLAHAAMSVRESVKTFIAVSRLTAEVEEE